MSESETAEDILKKSGVTRLKEKKEIDSQLNKVENRIRLLKMEYHKKYCNLFSYYLDKRKFMRQNTEFIIGMKSVNKFKFTKIWFIFIL